MSRDERNFFIFAGVVVSIILCGSAADSVAHRGDVGETVEGTTGSLAMWETLHGLSEVDRENVEIELETDHDLPFAHVQVAAQAEALWTTGRFDEAVAAVRSLEDAGVKFAVGMDWKVPREMDFPDWAGSDVRIGGRDGVVEADLDFDAQNGNLFAVLRYPTSDTSWQWSVNLSTDGGQTWQETYTWGAGYEIKDVSAAVVDDFLYVGYVGGGGFTEARMRRVFASDGTVDSAYGYETLFDNGVAIDEIALVTNADDLHLDNRVYYLAIQADNSLIYYWGSDIDTTDPIWTPDPTGVTDALIGLDATWDASGDGHFLFVSYIGSAAAGPVMVLRHDSGVWEDIEVFPEYAGVHNRTSVSAYGDTAVVAFGDDFAEGPGISYFISYNDGDSWSPGSFRPEPGSAYYWPDVTARGGQGTAITFSEEAGEFDPVWVHYRDHYSSGPWDAMVAQINEVDAATANQNLIQWIPPGMGESYAFGVIYVAFDPVPGVPYFDRVPLIFADGLESGDTSVWSAEMP
jgi:hypothetical protein